MANPVGTNIKRLEAESLYMDRTSCSNENSDTMVIAEKWTAVMSLSASITSSRSSSTEGSVPWKTPPPLATRVVTIPYD
jgi:hypothetical protein